MKDESRSSPFNYFFSVDQRNIKATNNSRTAELISIPATPRVSTPEIQTPSGQRSPRQKSSTAWTNVVYIPQVLESNRDSMKGLVNMKGSWKKWVISQAYPQDAWLPITESRNGNAHYAAFHNLNAGVGFQALDLGILSLTIAYCWQLYTLWILVQLHEAVPGKRERLGVWLALFPTVYLSAGTATALILIGGETMKLFFQIVCGPQWLSLVGAVTAITYSTMVWVLSVSQQDHPQSLMNLSHFHPAAAFFSVMNALGIVAFAFRGHNVVLEIQATMPSTFKHPAHVPMWRGAKVAYSSSPRAFSLLPLEAFGLMETLRDSECTLWISQSPHIKRTSCLDFSSCGIQLSEQSGTTIPFKPCWTVGRTHSPVTFAYPCFMWVLIKRPAKYSFNWYFNWILGWLGIAFSLVFSIGGVWSIANNGLKLKFFKPN
ncbi:Lysine histidine transporter-like 8 [Hibiscus syriacus]|uniref:Lysine histidine transporter-like 8 n=1 Tax=Hibiscus syriacus TaxID=106335 RepID=A0A6A2WUL5_HIBSY|nr:Lysine histidine transporter-like 8 [Hibiscus syriacus]